MAPIEVPRRMPITHVCLARAYYLSSSEDPENLSKAEASLQELVSSADNSVDHVRAPITLRCQLVFIVGLDICRIPATPMDEDSSAEKAESGLCPPS